MGSRIMHLIIANEITKKIFVTNKADFLLGGIAPDAVSPKELSHFFTGDNADFTRRVDYNAFVKKYGFENNTDYIAGYYTHLIADDLWLTGFFLPWLKNRMENDQSIFERYHHDFRMLNGKLVEYYNITTDMVDDLEEKAAPVDLQEVSAEDVKAFVPHVKGDMNYSRRDLEEALNVFTFDQIVGYIETSVEKSVFHLEKVLKEQP